MRQASRSTPRWGARPPMPAQRD